MGMYCEETNDWVRGFSFEPQNPLASLHATSVIERVFKGLAMKVQVRNAPAVNSPADVFIARLRELKNLRFE